MSKIDKRREENELKIQRLKTKGYSNSEENIIEERYKEITDRVGRPTTLLPIENLFSAPDEWNFFPPLSQDKQIEMMFSIMANGLFSPIIVWEQEDGKYMILSGHNRVDTYNRIYETYKDENVEKLMENAEDEETYKVALNFDIEDFLSIEAFIYKYEEIDEVKAREIIIDTNYVQRDEDKKLTTRIVMSRLEIIRNRRDIRGKTMNIVARELNMSATKVYEETVLANDIIEEVRDLFYNGQLSRKAVLSFKHFSKDMQSWIIDNHGNILTNKMLRKISPNKNYSKEEISNMFELANEEKPKVKITIEVEEELVDEFREMAKKWLYNKKQRK